MLDRVQLKMEARAITKNARVSAYLFTLLLLGINALINGIDWLISGGTQAEVAAYVENGGFGATWAAPIASLLVEKYLNGDISDARKPLEQRVLSGDLMHKVKKDR